MGVAYMNRKKLEDRSESDFYQTPRPLTWELLKLGLFDYNKTVLEPACGNDAIYNILVENFNNECIHYDIQLKPIYYQGKNIFNFLEHSCTNKSKFDYIISNPPFSLWDSFVLKAKEVAKEKIAFIGKTNFFGAKNRYYKGVWKNLSDVYIFNRQVDYRYFREDNKLICGGLITGWFIWDMSWKEDWWKTHIIDIDKYVLHKNN